MTPDVLIKLLTPIIPDQMWYLPYVVLGLLAASAYVDARTGRVPNLLIGLAFAQVLFLSLVYEGAVLCAQRAVMAVFAYAVLRLLNALYFLVFRRDALGMGDAKWTGAAASCFGLPAVAWAWIFAAWFGLVWLGVRFLIGLVFPSQKRPFYIFFSPFLFIGLVLQLYGPGVRALISF